MDARRAPQRVSSLIRRIRLRISIAPFGRPPSERDFQLSLLKTYIRQYSW